MLEWHLGLCVFSERTANGFIGLQPDYLGGATAGGTTLETLSPHGLRSRPRDPTVDVAGAPVRASGLLYAYDGREGFALPTQDPRWAAYVPDEGKGGAVLYATLEAGSWRDVAYALFEGADGSFTLRVPYALGAKEHLIEVDVAGERIRLTHGDGLSIEITSTEIRLGGDTGQYVALAAPLATYLTAIASALAGLGANPGPVPTIAALTTKAV